MYTYCAYGLNIHSVLPLPELIISEGKADVMIRFGKVEYPPTKAPDTFRHLHVVERNVYLTWDDVGSFLVRDGCEIIIDPILGVEERVVRLFLLGTSLAMLLQQRGLTILHASAVAKAGQVVAFAGEKGAGKSTFAGALHTKGYELVADDILAIDASQGRPMVLPGFPHLKLWPDSASLLGCDPEDMPRLRPELEKRAYALTTRFSQLPLPLRCVYILSPGCSTKIEPLQSQDALTALMPYWYGARFGMETLRALGLASFFLQCASLVKSASIYRLKRPPSLLTPSDVVQLITPPLCDASLVSIREKNLADNT